MDGKSLIRIPAYWALSAFIALALVPAGAAELAPASVVEQPPRFGRLYVDTEVEYQIDRQGLLTAVPSSLTYTASDSLEIYAGPVFFPLARPLGGARFLEPRDASAAGESSGVAAGRTDLTAGLDLSRDIGKLSLGAGLEGALPGRFRGGNKTPYGAYYLSATYPLRPRLSVVGVFSSGPVLGTPAGGSGHRGTGESLSGPGREALTAGLRYNVRRGQFTWLGVSLERERDLWLRAEASFRF